MSSQQTKINQVINHLITYGSITSWEAINKYRATRLSGIIFVLIHDRNFPITSKMVYEPDGTRYAVYSVPMTWRIAMQSKGK
jgi:hypothetical protein